MSNTALDSQEGISVYFVGHAEGLIGRTKLNFALLRGDTPLGVSNQKTLVQGDGLYGLKEVAHLVLSTGGDGAQQISINRRDSKEQITHLDTRAKKTLGELSLTDDTKINIANAVKHDAIRQKIADTIGEFENYHDKGMLHGFDVYKVANPENHDGAEFVCVEFRGVSTPSGYISATHVTAFNSEGNKVDALSAYNADNKQGAYQYAQPKAVA